MEDKPFLDGYGGQTTDELLALAQQFRTDSIVLAIEEALQLASESRAISLDESHVLAVCALEREVNNGGYDQFFFNSSNEYADTIVGALDAIGCPKTAKISEDAISALGIVGDITKEAIEEMVSETDEEVEEALEACDRRFFKYEEPIADRLLEWIGQNRKSIQATRV